MSSTINSLQITPEELDELGDLDISTTLAVDVYRAIIFRKPKQLISVVLTEIFVFGLSLIFVMPISLIVLRNLGKVPEDTGSIIHLLVILVGIALFGILIWNIYLWQQAKQVKSLARLMEEIEKYNAVVNAIALIETIESASPSRSSSETQDDIVSALYVTKQSLIEALRVEKVIRNHKRLISNHQELFVNLEEHLSTLMAFEVNNQVSEYRQLMSEALQIGMSIHREVRRLRNQRL